MFDKIKNFLLMVAGVVIGFLCLILGIKKKRIETLETENKVKDVTIKTVETARDAESVHAVEMADKINEASETAKKVTDGEKSYNDIVREWNESKG